MSLLKDFSAPVCHELGGVRFQSISSELIPRLHGEEFSPFCMDCGKPDVTLHLVNLGQVSPTVALGGLAKHPEVVQRLSTESETKRSFWADEHGVCIRDFDKRELHFFYWSESGG